MKSVDKYTVAVIVQTIYHVDGFGGWDSSGCREVIQANGEVTCECTQLGHFGLLLVSYHIAWLIQTHAREQSKLCCMLCVPIEQAKVQECSKVISKI